MPQNRERIYIVCFKNEEDGSNKYEKHFQFPEALALTKKVTDIVDHSVSETRYFLW